MTKDDKIISLNDYQHARIRTEMYLGGMSPHTQEVLIYENDQPKIKEQTWVPALYCYFREILDNALDEIKHGYGDRVDVTYDQTTFEFSVKDNGRGIPIKKDEATGLPLATMAMSHARAGRNFGERSEEAGLNGVGASVVNFCSEWFKITISRDNVIFHQEFHEGNAVFDDLQVKEPDIKKKQNQTETGTLIEFKPSSEVFKTKNLPLEFVYSRLVDIAIANPKLKLYFNNERVKSPKIQTLYPNHFKVDFDNDDIKSTFYLVPNFMAESDAYHSIVNNIPMFTGGTHIDMFKLNFYKMVLSVLEPQAKKRKLQPNKSDVLEGLFVFNISRVRDAKFDGQAKSRLTNESAGKSIDLMFKSPEMLAFFKDLVKKEKDWIDSIFQKCAERTNKKEDDDTKKLQKKLSRLKVPKLIDATGKDRTKCILLLAEGQSAIAGMSDIKGARETYGGLGLRGKILNVNGEKPKVVLENEILLNIMNSIGLVIGSPAIRSELRYGKVYLAHDMDFDGMNIGALLINFFYSYWPELFDPEQDPFIYVFMTPYLILEKGKERKYFYGHDYQDYNPEDWKGWHLRRAKGLGTLSNLDWEYSIRNPVLYPVVDDGLMKEALDLVFNDSRADDRKIWISL